MVTIGVLQLRPNMQMPLEAGQKARRSYQQLLTGIRTHCRRRPASRRLSKPSSSSATHLSKPLFLEVCV